MAASTAGVAFSQKQGPALKRTTAKGVGMMDQTSRYCDRSDWQWLRAHLNYRRSTTIPPRQFNHSCLKSNKAIAALSALLAWRCDGALRRAMDEKPPLVQGEDPRGPALDKPAVARLQVSPRNQHATTLCAHGECDGRHGICTPHAALPGGQPDAQQSPYIARQPTSAAPNRGHRRLGTSLAKSPADAKRAI